MEGYLLKDTNLRIKADPSFFCQFSKSLLLEPVTLIVGNSIYNVERASLEDWFEHVGRKYCPITGKRITTWVVIKPNNALRERIKEWARQQKLDMDALEAAALKARKVRRALSQGLPRALSETHLNTQANKRICPTEEDDDDSCGWTVIDVTKPAPTICSNIRSPSITTRCSKMHHPVNNSMRSCSPRSLSVPRCVRA